jgi:hypothetical protein
MRYATSLVIAMALLARGSSIMAHSTNPPCQLAPTSPATTSPATGQGTLVLEPPQPASPAHGNTLVLQPLTPPAPPADPIPPATAPATNPANDPVLRRLLDRLADADYEVRTAAQKDLDAIPAEQRDLIVKLAEAATDPEARARLQKRIDTIDEQAATNPPPISLDLHDASFSDMVDALKKATGANIQQWPDRGFPGGMRTFTIHAVKEPFWKVFMDLSNQQPLSLQPGWNERFKIMGQQLPGLRRGVVTDGFAVFPLSITRSVDLQPAADAPARPPQMSLSCTLAADPRIKVLGAQITLTDIADDAGHILLKAAPANGRNMQPQHVNVWSLSQSWDVPDHLGKKIASAKGIIRARLAVGEIIAELAKPAANTTLAVGDRTLKISMWKPGANGVIEFQMTVEQVGGAVRNFFGGPGIFQDNQIDLSLVDSTNRVVYQFTFSGGWGGGISVQGTPPFRIRVSVPSRTKIVEIPFELKDVPLP